MALGAFTFMHFTLQTERPDRNMIQVIKSCASCPVGSKNSLTAGVIQNHGEIITHGVEWIAHILGRTIMSGIQVEDIQATKPAMAVGSKQKCRVVGQEG